MTKDAWIAILGVTLLAGAVLASFIAGKHVERSRWELIKPDTVHVTNTIQLPPDTVKGEVVHLDDAEAAIYRRYIDSLEARTPCKDLLAHAQEPIVERFKRQYRQGDSYVDLDILFRGYPLQRERNKFIVTPTLRLSEKTVTRVVTNTPPKPLFVGVDYDVTFGSDWKHFEPFLSTGIGLKFHIDDMDFKPALYVKIQEKAPPEAGWKVGMTW